MLDRIVDEYGKIGNKVTIRMFKLFNEFTDLREKRLHESKHWHLRRTPHFALCTVKRSTQLSFQQNPPLPQRPPMFTALWQRFLSIAAAPPISGSHYACLSPKITFFVTFSAVVKSPVLHNAQRAFLQHNQLYRAGFAFTHHSLLITRNCLPPTVWRDWQKSATKTPYPPQNRQDAPVLSPRQAILPLPPLPPQQKREPVSRFPFISFLAA
jgi:hypothetical protein